MLNRIIKSVFGYKKNEKITLLYDLPYLGKDTVYWRKRRQMALNWIKQLGANLATYNATYANNAELPENCQMGRRVLSFDKLFSETDIVIMLNEFSATAPMHKYAKKYRLRVASMPGFNDKMTPALEIDYIDVAKKVDRLFNLFKICKSAYIAFMVNKKKYSLQIDLKEREPIKDDGICTKKGRVINLPGGECFIAPYDEKESNTNGFLPIEQEGKVTVYNIEHNRVIDADNNTMLLRKIKQDPAVGNIAEMAFGILSLYGIKPCGRVLLDEKLGMHIALGRDDHFGGTVGPASFMKKKNIWHQDFVYTNEMQPKISVKEAKLGNKLIIKNSKYVLF